MNQNPGRGLLASIPEWRGHFHLAISWKTGLVAGLALRFGVSGIILGYWFALRNYLEPLLQSAGPGPLNLPQYSFPLNGLISLWVRWDAYRYIGLAIRGYFNPVVPGDTVFYPLLPLLIRWLGQFFQMDYTVAGLLVSTLASITTFALLFQLAQEYFGQQTARWSVIALAIYPTSLFLTGPYTESLFLAFTLAAFLLARRRQWLLAGAMGALASLTRGPGVFTSVVIAWIAFTQLRAKPIASWKEMVHAAAGVFLPAGAATGFVLWRQISGFAPISDLLLSDFGVHLTNPLSGLINAWVVLVTAPTFTVIMEGITAILWLGLFGIMLYRYFRPGDQKTMPFEWLIFMIANLLTYLSKETTIISPLQSIGRYVLVLFPGFIFIAIQLTRTNPRIRQLYVIINTSLLMIFCALYVIGTFVG